MSFLEIVGEELGVDRSENPAASWSRLHKWIEGIEPEFSGRVHQALVGAIRCELHLWRHGNDSLARERLNQHRSILEDFCTDLGIKKNRFDSVYTDYVNQWKVRVLEIAWENVHAVYAFNSNLH